VQDPALVLLDRFYQAASFPELVLALQTRSGAATVDYSCGDEMVTLDAADASRPMISAVLQTGWGVAPTHEHFSGKKQAAETNFLWSAGSTPFGPFSQSTRLNFAIVDAARRNLVFSALNASIAQVADALEKFSRFGKHMEDVLLPAEHVHFVRRWNVLKFKIRRTSTYLSLLNFDTALFYARSTRHDVRAIRNIVLKAGEFVHSYVGCLHDEQPSYLKALVYLFSGLALLIMAYVLIHSLLAQRRAANFKKKL
jgi:membrane-bound inhibitor of C-type lysozyme